MLFALNGLYWSHKKLSIISSIDVKRLFQMSTPVFVFFNHKKKELLVRYQKFLGFYYKQIIAWPARSIWQYYRLLIFQNFQNTTRGILDNFEISLVVLLPNTTTSHAINYTTNSY